MKKIIVILFLCLTATPAFAEDEWKISASALYNIYSNENLENSPGARIDLSREWLVFWASYERPQLFYGGQQACKIPLIGFGIGFQHRFDVPLTLRIDAGYYFTKEDVNEESLAFKEAMYIRANQTARPFESGMFPHWEYELKNAFGGSISLSYDASLSESWFLSLSTGYRYLRVRGDIWGHNGTYEQDQFHWIVLENVDLSAIQAGVMFTYKW